MVFITVPNLVGIDAVFSILYAIFNILRVRLENAYSRPKIGVLEATWGRDGAMLTPNELVLTLGVVTFVPLLAKID